ncbi:MAG: anion permease, partial [Solirubrobacteraceae bacterium]
MDNDLVLWIVVATALVFDFTNGFHDTANAVATSISTRAMAPRVAVGLAAALNFVGAFLSLAVAATIASGIVDPDLITLALVANGNISPDNFEVPFWVVVSSAAAIALGTYSGGWRIIRTMGSRIIKMDPAQGFSAQSAGATVILVASHLGYPLSTTH